jgi:hypothetical protein
MIGTDLPSSGTSSPVASSSTAIPGAAASTLADLVSSLLAQPDMLPGRTPAVVPADLPAPASFCLWCVPQAVPS